MRFLTSLLYLASVALRLAVVIVPPFLVRPYLGYNLPLLFFVPMVWITVTMVVLFYKEIQNMPRRTGSLNDTPCKQGSDIDLDSWRIGRPFADDWNSSIKNSRHF